MPGTESRGRLGTGTGTGTGPNHQGKKTKKTKKQKQKKKRGSNAKGEVVPFLLDANSTILREDRFLQLAPTPVTVRERTRTRAAEVDLNKNPFLLSRQLQDQLDDIAVNQCPAYFRPTRADPDKSEETHKPVDPVLMRNRLVQQIIRDATGEHAFTLPAHMLEDKEVEGSGVTIADTPETIPSFAPYNTTMNAAPPTSFGHRPRSASRSVDPVSLQVSYSNPMTRYVKRAEEGKIGAVEGPKVTVGLPNSVLLKVTGAPDNDFGLQTGETLRSELRGGDLLPPDDDQGDAPAAKKAETKDKTDKTDDGASTGSGRHQRQHHQQHHQPRSPSPGRGRGSRSPSPGSKTHGSAATDDDSFLRPADGESVDSLLTGTSLSVIESKLDLPDDSTIGPVACVGGTTILRSANGTFISSLSAESPLNYDTKLSEVDDRAQREAEKPPWISRTISARIPPYKLRQSLILDRSANRSMKQRTDLARKQAAGAIRKQVFCAERQDQDEEELRANVDLNLRLTRRTQREREMKQASLRFMDSLNDMGQDIEREVQRVQREERKAQKEMRRKEHATRLREMREAIPYCGYMVERSDPLAPLHLPKKEAS